MVVGALLIAVVVAAIGLLTQLRAKQNEVIDRYFTAVTASNLRFTEQIDAETAVRGYALTGNSTTLQPLTNSFGTDGYAAQAVKIESLLPGDAAALNAFRRWDAASQAWYEQSARPTIALTKAHGPRAVTTRQVLAGKTLFDLNRRAFLNFSRRLAGQRAAASNSVQLRTTLLFTAVLLLAGSLALASVGLWWGLRRWVLDPLAALGDETRLVREGELGHDVAVSGPREIRALAGDVDEMRRDIVDQLAAVETARVEIEAARERLEVQATELARSNRDLEQFAYVASHDLQEPLRKVASFCQMLDRRYSGQLDERADQYIAFAVDGAKRMQQLINDLLAFSRVGRSTDAAVEVDLQSCLGAALENLAVASEASGLELSADPLPRVTGQPGLLTQLLQNLIGNSIKFRSTEPPRVHLGVHRDGGFWEFCCADNGLGIEPQYAERIFVIFQRLYGKDEYAGTGIGLALCKRIVEHHGGRIWLDTDTAEGTTFRWTLPIDGSPVRDTQLSHSAAQTTDEEPR
jgi:signal transduction histidine kinase